MPTPTKLAAALSAAKPAGTMPSDENETIDVALRSTERGGFELGGRSGRVVTFSDHPAVHKGFRVLKVDGKELDNASASEVADTLAAARRRGAYTVQFAGGKPTGGGGWLAVQAIGKSKAAAEAAAARRAASERAEADRAEAARLAAEKAGAEKALAQKGAADKDAANKAAAAAANALAEEEEEARRGAAEPAAAAAAKEVERAEQDAKQRQEEMRQLATAWERSTKSTLVANREAFRALPTRSQCAEPQQALLAALSSRPPLPAAEEEEEEDGGGEGANENECGPCDKCDGKHATFKCPYFKKPRDKHKDAFEHYSGDHEHDEGSGGGGSGKGKPSVRSGPPPPPPLPNGTRVVAQPGDGSCLFHSLSHGMRDAKLGSRHVDAEGIRGTVAAFIEQHPDADLGGTPLSSWIEWESGMEVSAYCARMRTVGEWGGALEIAIASRIWEMSIHVYERAGGSFKLISAFDGSPKQAGAAIVRVLYSGRCHYDALIAG